MPSFEKQFTLKRGRSSILHREPQAMIRWIKRGKMNAARLPGGHYLIPESEVLRLLARYEPKALQGF
jgi:predicted site-specific integrase-resolvase